MAHAEKPQDLHYIKRRFINKDNLRAAIAEVVNAIFKARSPHIWGEATTACASDSKKFAAWDQNLLTERHIRYRGPGIIELRREIHEGLNVIENWNSANSFIFYGRSSEIATNNREDQEIAVLSMHLLQVCMVYMNTLMLQKILAEPDWLDRLKPEDLRALTPLIYAHINPYGRFYLDMDDRLNLDD